MRLCAERGTLPRRPTRPGSWRTLRKASLGVVARKSGANIVQQVFVGGGTVCYHKGLRVKPLGKSEGAVHKICCSTDASSLTTATKHPSFISTTDSDLPENINTTQGDINVFPSTPDQLWWLPPSPLLHKKDALLGNSSQFTQSDIGTLSWIGRIANRTVDALSDGPPWYNSQLHSTNCCPERCIQPCIECRNWLNSSSVSELSCSGGRGEDGFVFGGRNLPRLLRTWFVEYVSRVEQMLLPMLLLVRHCKGGLGGLISNPMRDVQELAGGGDRDSGGDDDQGHGRGGPRGGGGFAGEDQEDTEDDDEDEDETEDDSESSSDDSESILSSQDILELDNFLRDLSIWQQQVPGSWKEANETQHHVVSHVSDCESNLDADCEMDEKDDDHRSGGRGSFPAASQSVVRTCGVELGDSGVNGKLYGSGKRRRCDRLDIHHCLGNSGDLDSVLNTAELTAVKKSSRIGPGLCL